LNQNNDTNHDAEFTVVSVNDCEFLFDSENAGAVINFASEEFQQCRLSFIQSKFRQGYSAKTSKLGEGELDLTCLSNTDYFALSDTGSTYAEMTVVESGKTAKIKLNFSLLSMKSKRTVARNHVILSLDEQQTGSLLKKASH